MLISLDTLVVKTACCEQDDRDVTDDLVLFQLTAELQSIHDRHHNIGDDKVGYYPPCHFQPTLTINGFAHLIYR